MTLSAAFVHEESREPIDTLLSVATESYSKEVQRFLVQIESNNVAINGANCFVVDRGLILEVNFKN